MNSQRHGSSSVRGWPAGLTIARAGEQERLIIRNLMQLYLYEMSEFEPRDVDEQGLFRYQYLDSYWNEPGREPLLARVRGLPGGLALVQEGSVLDARTAGVRTIAELFVMKAHRRQGIAQRLALEAFRRFPGRWEVREMESNEPAKAFWRKVIGEYTAGRFVELSLDDHRWRGPVQTFDNSLMVG